VTFDRKGVGNLKTMRATLDGRRVRTGAGALMELAVLANERQRLQAELDRWDRRNAEIQARLVAIAERETRLMRSVELPTPPGARPLPLAEMPRNVVTRELTY
jgi:hypothetical protein